MNEETQTYAENLPRKVTGKTCQSLSPNGELCDKPAAFEVAVQGDSGLHEDVWVAVCLCTEHAALAERQFWS